MPAPAVPALAVSVAVALTVGVAPAVRPAAGRTTCSPRYVCTDGPGRCTGLRYRSTRPCSPCNWCTRPPPAWARPGPRRSTTSPPPGWARRSPRRWWAAQGAGGRLAAPLDDRRADRRLRRRGAVVNGHLPRQDRLGWDPRLPDQRPG